MKYAKHAVNITIETIDNGYVTTISNEHDVLIASWYDVNKSDALLKIADQLGPILPGSEKDEPYPYTEGLEDRELTDKEADGMNDEMTEIRREHLDRGLKTEGDLRKPPWEKPKEIKNDKEETNTEDNTCE